MRSELIQEPVITMDSGDHMKGNSVDRITRTLADLKSVFADQAAFDKMPEETVVYEVESYFPVAQNTEGGLFYGITYIKPGQVGNEYFMTKGHFHLVRNRSEYYCTLKGEGMLMMMDENRQTHAEKMFPGSIHYIPGNTAHRTVNCGNTELVFSAFWPADAGHDYDSIASKGFSKICVNKNGSPALEDR